MMDGVPSKVNVLLQIVSYPLLMFFLRKVSNPGLVFFLWKVSNPGHGTKNCKRIGLGTQGISQLLFIRFTPEFLSLVLQELSWSRHQKLQEDWIDTKVISISLCLLSLFLSSSIYITLELQEMSLYQFI